MGVDHRSKPEIIDLRSRRGSFARERTLPRPRKSSSAEIPYPIAAGALARSSATTLGSPVSSANPMGTSRSLLERFMRSRITASNKTQAELAIKKSYLYELLIVQAWRNLTKHAPLKKDTCARPKALLWESYLNEIPKDPEWQ